MIEAAAPEQTGLLVRHDVRVRRASIHYGCHAGTFVFPSATRPIVVYGPNGSGKTTFLEALVRGMYGFNPRVRREKSRLEDRTPWSAATFRTVLTLETSTSVWTIERDFVSMEVVIHEGGPDGRIVWEGGESRGQPSDERDYRRHLSEILGLPEREAYENTAVLAQGWPASGMGDHLLRVASGGHAPLERVKETIQGGHQEITGIRIDNGQEQSHRAGRLQRLEAELIEMRAALDRARAAEERRAPVVRSIDQLESRLRKTRGVAERLEEARSKLSDRRALEAEVSRTADRLRSVESLREELDAAEAEEARSREAWNAATADGEYPGDLPERLARLEPLWDEREQIEEARARLEGSMRRPGLVPAAASGTVGVTGLIGFAIAASADAWTTAVAILVVALSVCAGLLGLYLRARRRYVRSTAEHAALGQRLVGNEAAIEELAAPIGRGRVTRESADGLRDGFDRQQALHTALEREVERRSSIAERVGRVLEDLAARSELAAAGSGARERLERSIDGLQRQRAILARRLEGLSASALRLPDGVAAEPEAVSEALARHRATAEEIELELQEMRGRLVDQASPRAPSIAIRERVEGLEAEVEGLRRHGRAFEQAYALVGDAYEAFRSRDQDRLVERISTRISELSAGALGPVEVGGSLADATVRVAPERSLLIETPPLSFGEYQIVSLGIRLGAADFLSSAGLAPPFLADEPFGQLDDDAVESVWSLLREVGRARQIVITVRSRRLLEQLGIEADIDLEEGPPATAVSE